MLLNEYLKLIVTLSAIVHCVNCGVYQNYDRDRYGDVSGYGGSSSYGSVRNPFNNYDTNSNTYYGSSDGYYGSTDGYNRNPSGVYNTDSSYYSGNPAYTTPYYKTNSYNPTGGSNYANGYNNYNTYGTNNNGYNNPNGYEVNGYNVNGNSNGYDAYSTYTPYYNSDVNGFGTEYDYCRNRTPQHDIQMDRLMGMWYGVEEYSHLIGDSMVERSSSCVVVHIAEIYDELYNPNDPYHASQMRHYFLRDYRRLKMVWDESGKNLEYTFAFRNESQGYWQTMGEQNGTLVTGHYKQFTGAVQVLKAVSNNILLNFCQETPQPQLYSILLSREPQQLLHWEIKAAHELLRRKKLSVNTRRQVCGTNSAQTILGYKSNLTFILLFLVKLYM